MNSELLEMFSGMGGGRRGGGRGGGGQQQEDGKTVLEFKAGKMNAELQPNGKYMVTADHRRGMIRLAWHGDSSASGGGGGGNNNGGMLQFEWKDRRTNQTVDTHPIFPEDDCTFGRVDTGRNDDGDRVYLLQYGRVSDRRFFFWMQDGSAAEDESRCVKINEFMSSPEMAAAAAADAASNDGDNSGSSSAAGSSSWSLRRPPGAAVDSDVLSQFMQGIGATPSSSSTRSASNTAASNNTSNQVDALSNILQNLGMPPASEGAAPASSSASNSDTTSNASSAPASGAPPAAAAASGGADAGVLTLADLQAAMAGLQAGPGVAREPPGPPLQELVTPDVVLESGILDDDKDAATMTSETGTEVEQSLKQRLLSLLPENQRTEEFLEENLRSPQLRQCLKSLTVALLDGDRPEAFHSILANFSLQPEDGAAAMASGNPIQAFLDCILKKVQREQEKKKKPTESDENDKTESKSDNDDNDGTPMQEG